MGQAELRSPSILSPKSGPFAKGVANSNVVANNNVKTEAKTEANNHLLGRTEPALPVTPERLELIKAVAKGRARLADEAATSRIAQRFAPRAPDVPPPAEAKPGAVAPQTMPLAGLNSGIRKLTAVLIVAALLPNLTLALFWLGLIDPPWSEGPAPPSREIALPTAKPAARIATLPPVLTAPNVLDVAQGETVIFPIALDGTDGVPDRSFIVIKGLPPGSTLSDGYAAGETEWKLKPDQIGDLRLAVAEAANGESTLLVQLVAPDASVIATASTTLRTRSEPSTESGPYEVTQAAQVMDIEAGDAEAGLEETFEVPSTASIGTAPIDTASIETMPLPDRRPPPPGDPNWIRPTAWVNLRESPSSTAGVVSIVAKGVKLQIIGRKRGWVQVKHPGTSQSGWIYAGNLAAAR
jgi:Bacterial SH3 domain